MPQKHHMYVSPLDMDMDLKLVEMTQRLFFAYIPSKMAVHNENIGQTIRSHSLGTLPLSPLPGPSSPHP